MLLEVFSPICLGENTSFSVFSSIYPIVYPQKGPVHLDSARLPS